MDTYIPCPSVVVPAMYFAAVNKTGSAYSKKIPADLAKWAASAYFQDDVAPIGVKYTTKKSLQSKWRDLHGGKWTGISGSDTHTQILEKMRSNSCALGIEERLVPNV